MEYSQYKPRKTHLKTKEVLLNLLPYVVLFIGIPLMGNYAPEFLLPAIILIVGGILIFGIVSTIKEKGWNNSVIHILKYIWFIIYIFASPFILYFLITESPWVGSGEASQPLGLWFTIIPYWISAYLIYKYKKQNQVQSKQIVDLVIKYHIERGKLELEKIKNNNN